MGAWFFRDWAPVAPIDGVAWTLEVAAKFYLFIVVLWFAFACKRIWPVIVVVGIMVWVDKCKTAAPYEFHLGVAPVIPDTASH
ncbi:hypothetical protein PSP31121_04932 [Pandoraea sputorum]|uniref:Uncharacterized protein n=1 Tax=Pandoraea sputorum TaxID=93222 RepID=A0A5E5BK87_9BURK|nr:hypothetical protein PSP31121_04932 [Pandoraea sputorum]